MIHNHEGSKVDGHYLKKGKVDGQLKLFWANSGHLLSLSLRGEESGHSTETVSFLTHVSSSDLLLLN
jgi:hypothetical protein